MKINTKVVLWLALGVVIGLLFSKVNWFGRSVSIATSGTPSPTGTPTVQPTNAPVSVKSLQIQKGSVNIEYPVFFDLQGSPESEINNLISKIVSNVQSESDVTSVAYKINHYDDNLVSIVFSGSTYGFGAAHPNDVEVTLNYSFSQQKELQLSDILKTYNLNLDTISKDVINHFSSQFPPEVLSMLKDGAAPKLENYSDFTILNNQLEFIFPPYQIAPHSYGTLTYTINLPKTTPEK
jgi:hypothetical protein